MHVSVHTATSGGSGPERTCVCMCVHTGVRTYVGVCARGRASGHPSAWPPEAGVGTQPASVHERAHLALALPVGLVTVGIKAFADGTVARSAHGVPPPAFGARKVNPVGETGEQREGVHNCLRSQRKTSEARSLTWPASGPLPPPEWPQFPLLVPMTP